MITVSESPKLLRCPQDRPERVTQIYTDWANRCLAKQWTNPIQPPPQITDLSEEIRDFRVLAALLRAVEPDRATDELYLGNVKTNVDGLNECLNFVRLSLRIPGCEKVSAQDLEAGQLGATLQLIYSLSQYKHQQKLKKKQLQQQLSHDDDHGAMPPNTKTESPSRISLPQSRLITPTKMAPPKVSAPPIVGSKTPLGASAIGTHLGSATASTGLRAPTRLHPLSSRTHSGNNNGSTISSGCSSVASSATYASISSQGSSLTQTNQNHRHPVSSVPSPAPSISSPSPSRTSISSRLQPPTASPLKQSQIGNHGKSSVTKTGIRPPSTSSPLHSASTTTSRNSSPSQPPPSTQSTPSHPPAQQKMLKLKLFSRDKEKKSSPKNSPLMNRKAETNPPVMAKAEGTKPKTTGLKAPTKIITPKKEVSLVRTRPPPSSTNQIEINTMEKSEKRTSKSSEEDSAYAGFGSTSPTSSTSPSSSMSIPQNTETVSVKKTEDEERDLGLRDNSLEREKPTMAVKGTIAAPKTIFKNHKESNDCPNSSKDSSATGNIPPMAINKQKTLQSPTVGVVSPMLANRKLLNQQAEPIDPMPSSEPAVAFDKKKPPVPSRTSSSLDSSIEKKEIDDLVPAMAPIRQPPSYEQLLNKGRIAQSASHRGFPESSTSEDSLDSVSTTIRVRSSSATPSRRPQNNKEASPRSSKESAAPSESGIAIYAKMQARWKECRERATGFYHDSFEDSSSVSSGISENFEDISTDDVSGSSLSDHAMTAVTAYGKPGDYGHFVRSTGKGVRASSSAIGERRIHEQNSIQQLLQQCRTSQRGVACQPQYHTISGGVPHLSLSSDGETLSVQARSSLRIAPKRQDRPGIPTNGFHSLDRKCHLGEIYQKHHEREEQRMAMYDERSTMALISPRRTPQDLQQHNRHSVSAIMQLSSFGMSKSMVLFDPMAPGSPRIHRKSTDSRTVIGTPSSSHSEYGSPRSARTHHHSNRHRPPPPVRGSSPHSARLPLSVASPQHNGSLYARRTPEAVYANFRDPNHSLHRIPDEISMSPSHREKGSPGSDFRGSNLSVASSTAYNSLAEKYEAELRKLNRELENYRKTVSKLSKKQEDYSQMAEMVDQRLCHLVNKMEKAQLKPQEMAKLKQEIENLRNFSTRLAADSKKEGAGELLRHPSLESVASHRSSMSSSSKSSKTDKSSLNSFGSKAKKSWVPGMDIQIRSSFSKAFTRKKNGKNGGFSDSDGSPMHHPLNTITASNSSLAEMGSVATVVELKRQLQDRDHTLTDVRLDALDRAREVDVLRETVNRLKNENKQLRADMTRILYTGRSRTSSKSSLLGVDDDHLYENPSTDRSTSSSKRSSGCHNSVKVVVNVDLTGTIPVAVCPENEITIGYLTLPERETRWDQLDSQIYALFDAYLCRIDPDHHLGLHCSESVVGYTIGKINRERGSKESTIPPSQVITTTTTIRIFLKGACQSAVDSLILECLFPRSLLDQLLKHIVTHRRLVLSGATGIGKSNLARQLCAYLSIRAGNTPDSVVDIKIPDDGKDKQLVQVERDLEQALRGSPDTVLLLDNIPKSRISFVSAVFDSIQLPSDQGPYIICTINRVCQLSEMQMQLQHNFKIFLLTNKMEAFNGYMARFLRRRIIDTEYRSNRAVAPEIHQIVDFFSVVLSAINEFIERSNSVDATVGARVFLQCPLDVEESRVWFIDLWNETLVPYMMKVYREGVKILGRCGTFDDPTDRICEHWPWTNGTNAELSLHRLPIKEALSQPIARQSFSPLDALMKLQTRPSLLHENL